MNARPLATALAAPAAGLAALAAAKPAAAQGIFSTIGNAATEFSSNWPIIFGAMCFGLGAFLVFLGLYLIYQDRKYGSRGGQGSLATGAAAFVVGCCILGIVAVVSAGTLTFTGGAPTAGSGAAVAF